MNDKIAIEMDEAQLLWYLEGCARGSHLRQGCWHDMIKLYPKMSQSMRDFLYTYAKRDIAPIFEVQEFYGYNRPCGAESFDQFLACFNKDNRFKVTATRNGETITNDAYFHNHKYYTNDTWFFEPEYITEVKRIRNE